MYIYTFGCTYIVLTKEDEWEFSMMETWYTI